jgi:Flp pilus assembly protein TadD
VFDDDDDDDARPPTPIELGRFAQIDHLLAVGQLTRAKQLAVDQIAAEPSEPSSYTALSRVLLHMNEAEAAVEAAAQAVRLAPDWDHAWSVHASALLAAGRFAACETSLLEAIRLEPADGSLCQMYARVLSLCGRPKEALVWAQRALELDPDDETAHHLFAAMLHRVHPAKWRVSEDIARRAVAMNPDDADSFAVLGSILMTRRRFDEAERHLRTALELDPNNSLALAGLAQVVMGKNWFYKPFLSYQLAMMRLGLGAQLLVVASVWAIVSLLGATVVKTEPASTLMTITYLTFCAYTWFALPITRSILRRIYPWL